MTPANMFFFGITIWMTAIAIKYFIEDIIDEFEDDEN